MKKLIALILALVCVSCLVGCSSVKKEDTNLLNEGSVKSISVTSLPGGYVNTFVGNDADAIVDYLSNLNLIADFEENPDEYAGGTWVISLEYDNDAVVTVYHFGNMFIKADNGPWYKMNYDEANRFDSLLSELDN